MSSSSSASQSSSNTNILKTIEEYDRLRRTASSINVERIGSIDVVKINAAVDSDVNVTSLINSTITTTNNGDESSSSPTSSSIPFFNFAMVMPFSAFRPDRIPLKNGVFQGLAAVMLAIEHLNTGNATIVEEIHDVINTQHCPIKFTLEAYDSALSQIISVDQIIDIIARDKVGVSVSVVTGDDEHDNDLGTTTKLLLPSAFLGAARSAVSIPTSIITGLRGFPQISPISTSTQLDDASQFTLFGRTVPSDAGTSIPAILYLRYELNVKHLAVMHVNDAYGNAYALGLQLAAAEYAPDMVIKSYDFPFAATPQIVEQTIGLLKQTQFRYFFGIIFSTVHYDPFMTEAYKQGIAGTGEHNWMFSDSVSTSIFGDPYEYGSPLHLASKGSSRIGAVGGVPGIQRYDLFLKSMNDLYNTIDNNIIQEYHPKYPNEPDYVPYILSEDETFYEKASAGVVAFLYDATVALGLAACNATVIKQQQGEEIENGQEEEASKTNTFFNGIELFEQFKQTTFHGASGLNIYNNITGTRDSSSARFTLLNFVEDEDSITTETTETLNEEGDEIRKSTKTIKLKIVETDVFTDGNWNQVESLILNDGTTIPPPDLPTIERNDNYIGRSLRYVGYSLSGCILLLSVALVLWTYIYRSQRVVKASQPVFLYVIAAGCFLMGLSILFLSYDDEIVEPSTCSTFCNMIPWFVSFGWILSFAALFTKTRRVNQIFHQRNTFRRIRVTVMDVMKPALFLMFITAIILFSWTALAPADWVREVSEVDSFGREVETKGYCTFNGDSVPYMVALGIVLMGALAFSVIEAYKARHVSTEFSESEYIFLVLCAILLMSFLGIPVMVIAREEPKARFFVAAGVIFVICLAILLLIFGPKMIALQASLAKKAASMEFVESQPPARGSGYFAPDGNSGPGRARISVTGINPNSMEVSRGNTGTHAEDSTEAEDDDDGADGIRIYNHPEEAENLKKRVKELQNENNKLRQRIIHEETKQEQAHVQENSREERNTSKRVGWTGTVQAQEHQPSSHEHDDDEEEYSDHFDSETPYRTKHK